MGVPGTREHLRSRGVSATETPLTQLEDAYAVVDGNIWLHEAKSRRSAFSLTALRSIDALNRSDAEPSISLFQADQAPDADSDSCSSDADDITFTATEEQLLALIHPVIAVRACLCISRRWQSL